MARFKDHNGYKSYVIRKYNVSNKLVLSNYFVIDVYESVVKSLIDRKYFILKVAFNLMLNYEYIRAIPTRDLDLSIKGIDLERATQLLVNDLKDYKDDTYSFSNISTEKLEITTNGYSGVRIVFDVQVVGTRIKDRAHIDIAVEEITSKDPFKTNDGIVFYSLERTLADKYVTAIYRGESNTRGKDFEDLYYLFDKLSNIDLFIETVKSLIKVKNISETLIREWLINYQVWTSQWVTQFNLIELKSVLTKINSLIFGV